MSTLSCSSSGYSLWVALLIAVLVSGGCRSPDPAPAAPGSEKGAASPPPAAPAPPAAPPPVQAYDKAVLSAATALFNNAKLPPESASPGGRYRVVIDPLIDGVTGAQTVATKSMGERLSRMMRTQYPQYEVQPFSAATVAQGPLVLIGTFTGVNAQRQTSGPRQAYRICLALADLRSGKLVSKGLAFALPEGVDPTPLPFFRDAPAWSEDPATNGYIRTCQGTKAGDPINPAYLERIMSAALVSEAIEAYDAGRYREALDLYASVAATPTGKQFRVLNGIYLANLKLGRKEQASAAFDRIVDFGLENRRLAVKFLFRPGSTAFVQGGPLNASYAGWLKAIATQTASAAGTCLEVAGHTSATGPEPLNERLSLLRAEYVRNRLDAASAGLGKRIIASGAGSTQTMIGNGRDDASDVLDRRVEFKVIGC